MTRRMRRNASCAYLRGVLGWIEVIKDKIEMCKNMLWYDDKGFCTATLLFSQWSCKSASQTLVRDHATGGGEEYHWIVSWRGLW